MPSPSALPAALSTPADVPAAWTGAAGTKFRMPQLRRHVVRRADLLERARRMAAECRLSLVCAPAGFGKSILLAQLAQSAADAGADTDAVWLSLDEDDNDANRMFATVLRALQGVPLEWAVDPQALMAQVDGIGIGSRAAVAGLINALCSYDRERLLLFIDDLHRITDAGALRLLDDIIDRLPPEVGVVIGSRVEPDLALARWRGRGELGELRMADLQFGEPDAQAFAALLLADGATPELVRDALARTEGWAAGLQLMFGSTQAGARAPAGQQAHTARRHLFEFLAHEVLTELPDGLRAFVLDCSVLPELTPALCGAVSGRADSRAVLEALYRRHLFLSSLDDTTPTLRFHDLFRDFLVSELERHAPQRVAELHVRAAQAETVLPRAVAHWLKAHRWDEALALMVRGAKPLLAVGSHAMLERWIEQLPAEVRNGRPEVAHLQGLIAWVTWDWLKVIPRLERAWAGYSSAGTQREHAGILAMLAGCYNSMGDAATATQRLDLIDRQELDAPTRVPFDTMRAWLALSQGRVGEVAPWLHRCADDLEQDLSALYPDIFDIFNGHFAGIPGALAPMRRLQALGQSMRRHQAAHWSSAVVAQGAWLEFWQGHRAAAEAALDAQHELQQHMPGGLALILSTHHLRALHAALGGRPAQAQAQARAMLTLLGAPQAASLEAGWGHGYLHVLARVLWMAQDAAALAALPPVLAERKAAAWPPHGLGHAMVCGQLALLRGELAAAERALLEAVALNERWRLPGFMGDPRPALAMLRLRQDDTPGALRIFMSVVDEALADDAIGLLLLEPPALLAPLLKLAGETQRPGWPRLLERLADWRTADGDGAAAAAAASPAAAPDPALSGLSLREQEVLALLAEGMSNKLIARRLDLSLHTVKRHVANILGKLDAGSRAEAVARMRMAPR